MSRDGQLRTQKREQLGAALLKVLHGGLWHTTLHARYESIRQSGFILPEPDIPDGDRWSTSGGPEWYPYVRSLGGVSLFDFADFDPATYSERCPMSNWHAFVPYQDRYKEAVWIEIDRTGLDANYISKDDLSERWKKDKTGRKVMPRLEAAVLSPIPRTIFVRAVSVREGQTEIDNL